MALGYYEGAGSLILDGKPHGSVEFDIEEIEAGDLRQLQGTLTGLPGTISAAVAADLAALKVGDSLPFAIVLTEVSPDTTACAFTASNDAAWVLDLD